MYLMAKLYHLLLLLQHLTFDMCPCSARQYRALLEPDYSEIDRETAAHILVVHKERTDIRWI